MKHLVIRNLGPLKEADVELKRINVIIGSQSSGKSCVLKTACYCTWVEKRIELTQTADFFAKDGNFLKELERFHKLQGYIKGDTFISYESDFMAFSYDNTTKTFRFEWKQDRWNYRRSKVSYIPAERNLVAVIPNWFQVKFSNNNILDFMADWSQARYYAVESMPVLNLGVSYHYNYGSKTDEVWISDKEKLDFINTSSGLQSLIPLFVHLNYILHNETSSDYDSLESKEEQLAVMSALREVDMVELYPNYMQTHFCDIFLEEPEENLFPPTQSSLVDWMIEGVKGGKQGSRYNQPSNLFIATHSPYILNAFMEKQDIDITLLYTKTTEGQITVKTATEEDIQAIYDYGVDAFFNIETLG